MKKLGFIILLLISTGAIAAISYDASWQKASNFYQGKQYDSAAWYWEQIAVQKPQNANVYYNLGNAYYRLNQIGLAVLNYERALRINPGFKEAKDNLLLAQSKIGNKIPQARTLFFVRWWQGLTNASMANTWAVVSAVLFVLMIGLIITKRLKTIKNLRTQWLTAAACLWAASMVLACFATTRVTNDNAAVVMENDTPLMSGVNAGKTQGLIPEGTVVEVTAQSENALEVRLPDGRTGWIEGVAATRI